VREGVVAVRSGWAQFRVGSRRVGVFRDREEAGRALGDALAAVGIGAGEPPVVFGIPRGGVVVAAAVRAVVGGTLDVVVAAKVRAPLQPELGLGAAGPGGTLYLDRELLEELGVPEAYLSQELRSRAGEIERRTALYRGDRPPPDVAGRQAVVVDDGIATGGTAVAALRWVRGLSPAELVLAAPVAPPGTEQRLGPEADRMVFLAMPDTFVAVGRWYRHFDEVTDDMVRQALQQPPPAPN
jgi:putative phosphoribosyl transferase